jgi:hypothetical protein
MSRILLATAAMSRDDDLKDLLLQVKMARLRLQVALKRARETNARHGHAERLADLRQLHRRTQAIQAQSQQLRNLRRTIH